MNNDGLIDDIKNLSVTPKKPAKRGPPTKKAKEEALPQADITKFKNNYVSLRMTKVAEKSVFSKISTKGLEQNFNVEEFAQFIQEHKAKVCVQQTVFIAPIMDGKKNNAINIALGRIKFSDVELRDKILNYTLENENLTRRLIDNFPTDEEFAALAKRDVGFGRSETFYKICIGYEEKLKKALYSLQFISLFNAQKVTVDTQCVKKYFQNLMDSKALIELLGILLFIGNVINGSSKFIESFNLNEIENFVRVRGKETNVLEFAVSKMTMRDELFDDIDGIAEIKMKNWEMFEIEVEEIKKFYAYAKKDENKIVVECCKKCASFLEEYENFLSWTQKLVEWVGAPIEPDFYTGLEIVLSYLCMFD